ncbi:MAG: glyoxylate carboligase [Actinomycetia bacterium]|nr:glyoxylate carboligase [Actinomycetes bacterium]
MRYDVNLSMLFTELPLLERPAAARAAGFDAVEMWWPFAVPVPGDREIDTLPDAGVRFIHIDIEIVMINNEYLGLIRQAELPYDMNYAVDLHYGEGGVDHVKVMEAFGCPARRVERPGDIAVALRWASEESARARLPVLAELMVEREANAAMGPSLDAITEFEPVPELVALSD